MGLTPLVYPDGSISRLGRRKVWKKTMQKYELLLVLPGTLDEKEAENQLQDVVAMVKEFGSDVTSSSMGKNRLAYPIKQIRYGYFYTVVFMADKQEVRKLQAKLSITRNILRGMVTHFNTELSANQKSAYIANATAGTMPAVAPVEVKSVEEKVAELVSAEEVAPAAPVVESKAERKIDALDIDAISKKLDDLMGGDVMPGV